jgi:hypothetical protein
MQPFVQQIQQLAQKVQQGKQAQQQAAAEADPTAQVILKTQMAETQRKQQEAQARMQLESKKQEQDFQLKIAELERLVLDLKSRYDTQTQVDANKTATQIAIADINNAAKERIAYINANMKLTADQQAMSHEQNMTALEASNQAQADIRQHGINNQQRALQDESDRVKAQLDAQQQSAQAEQEHQQQMMQSQQQAQQQMQQTGVEQMGAMAQAAPQPAAPAAPAAPQPAAPAAPQPITPPTGAI